MKSCISSRKMALLTILLMHMAGWAWAQQELKLAGVEYVYYPDSELKQSTEGSQVAFQEFGAFVNFPKVYKNERTIVIYGVSYGLVQSRFTNTSSESSQTFHRMVYNMMLVHRSNGPWMFTVRLAPTLATDFKEQLSSHDFVIQGAFVASKKSSEWVRWGGGLLYTTRLGRPLLLPAIQYLYKGNRQVLNVFIPAFIDYTCAFGSREQFRAGFRIGVNGANFNVHADQQARIPMDRLNYVRVNVGPQVSYLITRVLRLDFCGGVSTKRMYKFEDLHGHTNNYDSRTALFLNVGLVIVPPEQRE